jgi:hypothetical protein
LRQATSVDCTVLHDLSSTTIAEDVQLFEKTIVSGQSSYSQVKAKHNSASDEDQDQEGKERGSDSEEQEVPKKRKVGCWPKFACPIGHSDTDFSDVEHRTIEHYGIFGGSKWRRIILYSVRPSIIDLHTYVVLAFSRLGVSVS